MINLKIKLPEGYLNEEIRNEYMISHEMKEVWAVELDLLCEFDRVCKKYNLKYIADGGTLLGAIRHNGFIPWDDDIDLGMLRTDYEKFNKIAKDEFIFPYFWQTEETDPSSLRGHGQLRNSNTTGILYCEQDRNMKFNQGIFIDIFPFDDSIHDIKKVEEQFHNVSHYRKIACRNADVTIRYSYKNLKLNSSKKHCLKMTVLHGLAEIFPKKFDYKTMYEKYINECKKFNGNNSDIVADYIIPLGVINNSRKRDCFTDIENHDFEFIQIPVPVDYHSALCNIFGTDYMIMKKSNSNHGGVLFDTDFPYTQYL